MNISAYFTSKQILPFGFAENRLTADNVIQLEVRVFWTPSASVPIAGGAGLHAENSQQTQNVDPMLRRWPNILPALVPRVLFAEEAAGNADLGRGSARPEKRDSRAGHTRTKWRRRIKHPDPQDVLSGVAILSDGRDLVNVSQG